MPAAALTFVDLEVGQRSRLTISFTEASVDAFMMLTGDRAPIHSDVAYARAMGYPERIVHGMCVASHFSTILGIHLPGPSTVIHSVQLSFAKPIFIGQTVNYIVDVARLFASVQVVQLDLHVEAESGDQLVRGQAQCGFRKVP